MSEQEKRRRKKGMRASGITKKNNVSCEACGSKENLTVHHIKKSLEFELWSCGKKKIVLCKPCHVKRHKILEPKRHGLIVLEEKN